MSNALMLIYTVPMSHATDVAQACFEAGAGEIGGYRQCCWSVVGQGQFKPTTHAKPVLGECNALTILDEMRVEMVCLKHNWPEIERALLIAHPYETPAYAAIEMINSLPEPTEGAQ
tara:strand:+ start:208 stop:555 length:348 start_codon:yes stop_codon:yes gene_type:complete